MVKVKIMKYLELNKNENVDIKLGTKYLALTIQKEARNLYGNWWMIEVAFQVSGERIDYSFNG